MGLGTVIVGIEGGTSQGKTLVMTFFAIDEYRSYQKKLIANYTLHHIPYERITFADLIGWSAVCRLCQWRDGAYVCANCGGRGFDNEAIFLDEVHTLADSRASQTKTNKTFSYLVTQTEKQNVNLYYTTQDLGMVEKRLRQRTHIGMHVKRKGDNHFLTIDDRTSERRRPKRALVYGPDVYDFFNTNQVMKVVDTDAILKARHKKAMKDAGA